MLIVPRGIILAAVAGCLGILVFVVWPEKDASGGSGEGAIVASGTGSVKGVPLTGLPYRSIGIQIQRVDWIEQYIKCIDRIAKRGPQGLGEHDCHPNLGD